MKRILEIILGWFRKSPPPVVVTTPSPEVTAPDPQPAPAAETARVFSRELIAKTVESMIQKDIDAGWKEDKNRPNRLARIDEFNRRVGAPMGSPYCASGLWCAIEDACRELSRIFGVTITNPMPKTAASQAFMHRVPLKYRHQDGGLPGMAFVETQRANKDKGHTGWLVRKQILKTYGTIEYNTNEAGSREGDRPMRKTRTKAGDLSKKFACFADVSQWIFDVNVSKLRDHATIESGKSEGPLETVPVQIPLAFRSEWKRTVTLPARGKFFGESHYATTDDRFSGGRLFPTHATEGIDDHLERSFEIVKAIFPDATREKVYPASWSRQWTPPEGGKAGQAAVGDLKPTLDQELWQGNMMFAPGMKPRPGTKYLLRNPANDRKVVIQMGFEVGPKFKHLLGGVTREVQFALGATNETELELVGLLSDQSVPLGPVR